VLTGPDELQYRVLSIIAATAGPAGASLVSRELGLAGHPVSEATAGRLLRQLDQGGLTRRSGFQGRVLTEAGQERLRDLEAQRERLTSGQAFLCRLQVGSKQQIIDVLVARRAIERETARLAALHATDREVAELRRVVEQQRQHAVAGRSIADDDVRFHRLIAQAARNRVLEAAVDLIRQDLQLTPILGFIRGQMQSPIVKDHELVVEAIGRHSPEQAEQTMVRHLENVINDVDHYWDRVERREQERGGGHGQIATTDPCD